MSEPSLPPFIDDPACREVFAEYLRFFSSGPNVIRLEFLVSRYLQAGQARPDHFVPVARIAVTLAQAKMMLADLNSVIAGIETGQQLAGQSPDLKQKPN